MASTLGSSEFKNPVDNLKNEPSKSILKPSVNYDANK